METQQYDYDLVVIGAGPAGYEAAAEAVRLGMRTALIERRELGGTCLNRGCIPTKAMAHAAGLYAELQSCGRFGLCAQEVRCNMDAVAAYRDETVQTLRGGVALLLKKVDVLRGTGLVTAPHCVRFEPAEGPARDLGAKNILVAAGGRPSVPPIPGAQLPGVVTSDELLAWKGPAPGELLIIGGGVIGVEFASIFSALGSHVVIVEALDRLLANMDRELGQSIKLLLKKHGVETHTGARVERLERAESGVRCVFTEKDAPREAQADCVLLAVGRRPCGLEAFAPSCAPEAQRGFLTVDGAFCTSVESVYAVGDAVAGAQLAHAASAQALCAVRGMAGRAGGIRLDVVPACVYTDPEIACVGLSLDEARAQGLNAQSCKYVMSANGKTVLTKQERGFIKVVYAADTRRILGAQLMCARATDLVGELALAVAAGLSLDVLASVIHPHPTFCEAIGALAREAQTV